MPSIIEIKTNYGEEQARILNELAALAMGPLEVDIELSGGVKETLAPADYNKLMTAEGQVFLQSERDKLKAKYLELDMELRAAIEVGVEEVEAELAPKDVSASDILLASTMTEAQLVDAMDSALGLEGDVGEDAAKLAFQMARQKDFDQAVSHGITINETWGDLYAELSEAANDLGLDPGDKFETLAPKIPSKEAIFNQLQSDINVYGQMR
jgi:hypothetical protein